MKKLLFAAALLLCGIAANAQEGNSNFQIKAGVGISTITGGDVNDVNAKFDWKIGATYDINVVGSFSIQPGLLFESKGYKVKGGDTEQMDYLELPIMATYRVNKFVLQTGPYLAYGIAGSKDIFDKDLGFRRFDFGWGAGVGYTFDKFTVGIDFSYGLNKLDKDLKAYNLTGGVTLSYAL